MNNFNHAIRQVLFAVAILSVGCAGPKPVPFQAEKTRVAIHATPEIVANTLASEFLLPAMNAIRSETGQTQFPESMTQAQLLKETRAELSMTKDASIIHLSTVPVDKAQNQIIFIDFPYSYQNDSVSLVCNGIGIEVGYGRLPIYKQASFETEAKLQVVLLGIKKKAESTVGRSGNNR